MNKRSPLPLRNPSCRKENEQATQVSTGIIGESPNGISDILGVLRERSQERGHMNYSREDEKLACSLMCTRVCGSCTYVCVRVEDTGYRW